MSDDHYFNEYWNAIMVVNAEEPWIMGENILHLIGSSCEQVNQQCSKHLLNLTMMKYYMYMCYHPIAALTAFSYNDD
jgi:hypothetical protein